MQLLVLLVALFALSSVCSAKRSASSVTEPQLSRRARYKSLLAEVKYRRNFKGLSQRLGSLEIKVKAGEKERKSMYNVIINLHKNVSASALLIREMLEKANKPSGSLIPQADQQELKRPARHGQRSTPSPPASPSIVKYDIPKDCQEVYVNGGFVYDSMLITKVKPLSSHKVFTVPCVQFNRSGWVVVQKAGEGLTDFDRTWNEYKNGFGSYEGEFWLGNEKLHKLTSHDDFKLRIEIVDRAGVTHVAEYSEFRIAGEDKRYAIKISGYDFDTSTLPDGLTSPWTSIDRSPFTTKDRDNDEMRLQNCAHLTGGAWWFRSCQITTLTGYPSGSPRRPVPGNYGMSWYEFPQDQIVSTRILIRPRDKTGPSRESYLVTNQHPL